MIVKYRATKASLHRAEEEGQAENRKAQSWMLLSELELLCKQRELHPESQVKTAPEDKNESSNCEKFSLQDLLSNGLV